MNGWYLAGAAIGGFKLLDWRFRKGVTTHGSARFMNLWEASRRRLFYPKGFLIGDWKRGIALPVFFRGGGHILTVAPTRAGKGIGSIIPNALQWPRLFIFDPGGQIVAVCIKAWRDKRMAVFVLNPGGLHTGEPWYLPCHSFNPLDVLDPTLASFASDAGSLASLLITRTGHEKESFFLDRAEFFIKAILMWLVADCPPEMRNLVELRRRVTADEDGWRRMVSDMQGSKSDEAIKNAGNDLSRMRAVKDNRELSSTVSTMGRATEFLEDQAIRDAVAHSDFTVDDLKFAPDGAVVAVVVELHHKEAHAPFVRLCLGAVLMGMTRGKPATSKVLFQLDEFATLGRMDRVKDGLATLARYNVWFQIVVQSIGQLKEHYLESGWSQIEGNCQLQQYLAANDEDTSQHISRKLGMKTIEVENKDSQGRVSTSLTSRSVMTAQEVREMPENRQICFMGNRRPMLVRHRPYLDRPLLRAMANRDPYHPITKAPSATYPIERCVGVGALIAGWVLGPSKTFLLAAAIAAVWFGEVGIRSNVEQQGGWTYCTYQGVPASSVWKFSGACPVLKVGGRFFP